MNVVHNILNGSDSIIGTKEAVLMAA